MLLLLNCLIISVTQILVKNSIVFAYKIPRNYLDRGRPISQFQSPIMVTIDTMKIQ